MVEKSIVKNGIYNMAYKLLSVIFPLITVTYTSRILEPQNLGMVTYSQTIVCYFLIFALLGIPNYGIREVAKSRDREEKNKVFSEILVINITSTLLWTFLYCLFVIIFNKENLSLYFASGLLLALNVFNVDWFYQGIEEYGFIAFRSLVIKIIFVVALFAFVKQNADYIKFSFIYSIAVAGNYIFGFIKLKKYTAFIKKGINIKKHLKPIFALFAGTIANELYLNVDITMIGVICADSYVSYYSNPSKIMHVISNVLIALGAVILPRLSVIMHDSKEKAYRLSMKVYKTLLFIAMPCSFGVFAISKYMIPILFGDIYSVSIATMQILSILILMFAVDGGVFIPILISNKKEKIYTFATVLGAATNILFNYFLIKLFQHNGAAIASVLSKAIMMLIEIYYLNKTNLLPKENKYLIKTVFMSLMMVLSIFSLDAVLMLQSVIFKLIIEIMFGITMYFCCAFVLKDEIFRIILKKFMED